MKECQIFTYKLLLRRSGNFDFLGLKNFHQVSFWGAPTHADMILNPLPTHSFREANLLLLLI